MTVADRSTVPSKLLLSLFAMFSFFPSLPCHESIKLYLSICSSCCPASRVHKIAMVPNVGYNWCHAWICIFIFRTYLIAGWCWKVFYPALAQHSTSIIWFPFFSTRFKSIPHMVDRSKEESDAWKGTIFVPRLLWPLLLVCRWGQRFCEHHIAPRNSLSCTNWQRLTCISSSACPTRSRMDCCSLHHPLFFQLVFSLGASVLHGFRYSMLHMLRAHWIYICPAVQMALLPMPHAVTLNLCYCGNNR